MTDASHTPHFQPPSRRSLLISTALSLGVALLILVTAVLPAEYGLDPTGLGQVLGLNRLSETGAQPVAEPASEPASEPVPAPAAAATDAAPPLLVQRPAGELRSDELDIPLAPGQGLEFKVILPAGETLLYAWSSGEQPLYYDFHGEPLNGPKDYFLSYEEQTATQAQGRLAAPFEGTHGWYWRNDSTQPVTVRLKVSGFYNLPGGA